MRFSPGFSGLARLIVVVTILFGAAPLAAQDTPVDPVSWQSVITSQIEAFRTGDAPEAFAYAGQSFQTGFPNAFVFFEAIIRSGYAPIMQSSSHSFGDYRMSDDLGVVQQVTLIGKDQKLYQALYQLKEETDGWRVQGVALQQAAGIGI